jgi:hypothetical protein
VSAERARWITLLLYLGCLAIAILLLFVKQFHQSSFAIVDGVVNVMGLYAVPLSIIVTAVSSRRSPDAPVTGTTLILLFGSTVLWNGLVVGTLAYYDWASFASTHGLMHFPNTLADSFLSSVPGKLTFLVSGALTYFFVGDTGKQPTAATEPAVPPPKVDV